MLSFKAHVKALSDFHEYVAKTQERYKSPTATEEEKARAASAFFRLTQLWAKIDHFATITVDWAIGVIEHENEEDWPYYHNSRFNVVYIAHPISGDVKGNLKKIEAIVRDINLKKKDVIPFAPYFLSCYTLDGSIESERERGVNNNKEYFFRGSFDQVWIYGDKVSEGMIAEIELATRLGIAVFPKSEAAKAYFEEKKNKTNLSKE